MTKKLSVLVAIGIAAGFSTIGYAVGGPVPLVVFFIASFGGLALWLTTTYKTPIDPQKIVVPYLLAVVLFIIHVYEEYITDFKGFLYDLSGFHVQEKQFLTVAAFVVPVLWLTGLVLLLRRMNIGYYMLSFFFVSMSLAELSHFTFPFAQNGTFHYTPGMYTAALPLIPAGYGLFVVFSELRKQKVSPSTVA